MTNQSHSWSHAGDGTSEAKLGSFKTLEQFILERQDQFSHSTGAFSRLLRDIGLAAKTVNRDMRRAGLIDVYGSTGETNVQGEVQQKMDALAHCEFTRALRRGGECCLIGSEEHAEAIPLSSVSQEGDGKYIVLLDPLDGSSNIDVNVSVGTIFSIYRLPEGYDEEKPDPEAALQQVAVEVGDKGADVAGLGGPVRLRILLLEPVEVLPEPLFERMVVATVDREDATARRRLEVRVGKQKFTD